MYNNSNSEIRSINSMKTAAILVCRNDDYKEDDRIVVCINSMLETFDELWFVDWNSSEQKGPLLWKLEDRIKKNNQIKHIIITPDSVKALVGNDEKIQPCLMPLASNTFDIISLSFQQRLLLQFLLHEAQASNETPAAVLRDGRASLESKPIRRVGN